MEVFTRDSVQIPFWPGGTVADQKDRRSVCPLFRQIFDENFQPDSAWAQKPSDSLFAGHWASFLYAVFDQQPRQSVVSHTA